MDGGTLFAWWYVLLILVMIGVSSAVVDAMDDRMPVGRRTSWREISFRAVYLLLVIAMVIIGVIYICDPTQPISDRGFVFGLTLTFGLTGTLVAVGALIVACQMRHYVDPATVRRQQMARIEQIRTVLAARRPER